MSESLLVGILALAACEAPSPLDVTATLSPNIATLPLLDWETTEPGLSRVQFGSSPSFGLETMVGGTASTIHHAALFGMPALTTVYWRAITEIDGTSYEATGQILTGNVPSDAPDLEANLTEPGLLSSERYFLGAALGATAYLFIADREGRIVWYYAAYSNAPLMVWKVRFLEQQRAVAYLVTSMNGESDLSGVQVVSLEGEDLDWVGIPLAHHSFDIQPDGTVGALVYDVRPWTDPATSAELRIVGDALVEVAPDGTSSTRFSTWDTASPEGSTLHDTAPEFLGDVGDWTHGNSLEWMNNEGVYMSSLGFVNQVIEVDPDVGEVSRSYGGSPSEFCNGSMSFMFPHSPHRTTDNTLLLASSALDELGMIALEYDTESTLCLKEIWSYGKQDPVPSLASPEVLRLANGNTLFNGSTTGVVQEIAPDGGLVWQLVAGLGTGFSSIYPIGDLLLDP